MARASQAAKAASRAAIVAAAARRFRERGIEATSVADVMTAAGLTHGGFYRHFDSKDGLAAAAIDAAMEDVLAPLRADLDAGRDAAATRHVKRYLSAGHVDRPGAGCPLAALSSEARRGDGETAAAYARGAAATRKLLARALGGDAARAGALMSLLVGAVSLARSLDDPRARDTILKAARAAARVMTRG